MVVERIRVLLYLLSFFVTQNAAHALLVLEEEVHLGETAFDLLAEEVGELPWAELVEGRASYALLMHHI
jgi:hypothetical protein